MGKPVWGTCAGLIFLANKAVGGLVFFFFHSLFLIFDFDFARPLEHKFTDFFWVDLLLLN